MEGSPRVLVVQGAGRTSLQKTLEKHGFAVFRAHNGKQAVAQVKEALPPVAVIEPASLRINPIRLSQMLKRAAESILVMWILEQGAAVTEDGVADLCLERPFSSRKLINGVQQLLPETSSNILCAASFVFDVENREVSREGRQLRVTPKQAKLLEVLMRHPGQVLSRRYLMKHVWNTDYLGDTRTLDVHIRWVREVIESNPSDPKYVLTVRGVGYRFEPQTTETSSQNQ